jgi:hypothetical protein
MGCWIRDQRPHENHEALLSVLVWLRIGGSGEWEVLDECNIFPSHPYPEMRHVEQA